MAWLTSLLKKPDQTSTVEERPVEAPPDFSAGPSLAILIPDAAGISSFRIAFAPDSQTAAEYVASHRADIRRETHAFWAMQDKPLVDPNTHVEVLVLIRAEEGSNLVYIVSFLDLESALSFTRFEVRRGLHLGNVMIYWAAFAQLREELDGISITPAFAPPTEGYAPPRFEVTLEPKPEASTAIAEPEVAQERFAQPAAEPEVAQEQLTQPELAPEPFEEPQRIVELPSEDDPAEIQHAVEEYLSRLERPRQRATPPDPQPPVTFEPPVVEEPQVQPAADVPARPEPVPTADVSRQEDGEDLGQLWPEATPRISAVAEPAIEQRASPAIEPAIDPPIARPEVSPPVSEPEISSPVAAEQAAIDQAFVFQHETIESQPIHRPTTLETAGTQNGMIVEERPAPLTAFDDAAVKRMAERMGMDRRDANLQELAARLSIGEPEPGIETVAGDEELEFVALNSADPVTGLAASPKIDDFDIAYEVERLLRNRRLEQRDGPFSGFQSPPGRF